MKPQIQFLNFVPNEQERSEIRAMLERAYDMIPSDGELVTKVFRQGADVIVEMAVNSQNLTYKCFAKTRSIYTAVGEALSQVSSSIVAWQHRKKRELKTIV